MQDNISLFGYLTADGLMIPHPSGPAAGGRVVDSLTLMPSWIRNLILIDGQPIVEVDYSCMHPNIAMTLFGGTRQFINHQDVANSLGIPIEIVKRHHLSFFNKRYQDMLRSPLWNYYATNEATMLSEVVRQKALSPFGHKDTSRKLFGKEVEIMTDVMGEFYLKGIPSGYVYDAIVCKEDDRPEVTKTMNTVALDHGVYTSAK